MANPFTERRPWAAAIIAGVFGASVGMLYLNRGRLALLYFAAALVVTVAFLAYHPFDGHGQPSIAVLRLWLAPLWIVGVVHCTAIAWRWQVDQARHGYARWYSIIAILLAFPATALLIRTFLYQPFNAPSSSMSPTINVGDYFLASKFAYDFQSPQRGDVIVFRATNLGNAPYVKRIVGVPGDRVWMKSGRLYVNGRPTQIQKLPDFVERCGDAVCNKGAQYLETLPGGRTERILDLVPDSPIDNTPGFRVPADSYFVLGDNRDNSMDSRTDMGFVRRDSIIGRVALKFAAGGHWTWEPIR